MSGVYPWYDANWLRRYTHAVNLLEQARPEVLPRFLETFEVLRTRPDFEVPRFSEVLGEADLEKVRGLIAQLEESRLELHEVDNFGRTVVHDDPYLTQLQSTLLPLVSEAAGEPVEPSYNFLSLYTRMGVCDIHMDAPLAKWTLDLCLRQSEPWPIHISQVVPWPEGVDYGNDWQNTIKEDEDLDFDSYALEPGEAILFSGSSQWHYRDRHPGGEGEHFCHLLFFHFIPEGMGEVIEPKHWARIFDAPELQLVEALAVREEAAVPA